MDKNSLSLRRFINYFLDFFHLAPNRIGDTGFYHKIVNLNYTPDELFTASPFDTSANFDGALLEDDFFHHLFVTADHIEELNKSLTRALTPHFSQKNVRAVLLEGFNGAGKTTFIKNYIRSEPAFCHIYIDFHSLARHIPAPRSLSAVAEKVSQAVEFIEENEKSFDVIEAPSTKRVKEELRGVETFLKDLAEKNNPIISAIKTYLDSRKLSITDSCLYFVHSNLPAIAKFLSSNLISELEQINRKNIRKLRYRILNSCDFSDVFLIFFLHCFKVNRDQKPVIIYFDNLDAVELQFLSEYFRNAFSVVLHGISDFLQSEVTVGQEWLQVKFSRDFKFVFCLRDANGAYVNAHFSSRLNKSVIAAANLWVRPGAQFYRSIVRRRVDVIEKIDKVRRSLSGHVNDQFFLPAKEIGGLFRQLTEDPYFKRIVVPLFNSDYRKLIRVLYSIASNQLALQGNWRGASLFDFQVARNQEKYGLRGTLLHGIISFLRSSDYVFDYPFLDIKIDEKVGYCLHSRMILTVLLNHSRLSKSMSLAVSGQPMMPMPLDVLVRICSDIYNIKDIIKTLTDAFLFHEKDWVHLITFKDRSSVVGRQLEEKMKSAGSIGVELDDIEVTLNPAGVVYLKSLLTHFEFYSLLAGNRDPLFSVGLTKSESKNRYIFDIIISKTQRLVGRHIRSMAVFYANEIEGRLGLTADEYREGDFCFKHFSWGTPKRSGYLHSTRIINSHIDYLDKYRLRLLKVMASAGSFDRQVILSVNRILLGSIKKYIYFFRIGAPQGKAVMDSAGQVFYEHFAKNLRIIENSDYADFTTPVSSLKVRHTG